MFHLIEETAFQDRSKFYLIRSLISSVNAQIVGVAAAQVRKDERNNASFRNEIDKDKDYDEHDERPTIDKVNEYFAAKGEDNTPPVGLDGPVDPRELVGDLLALRNKWLDIGHEYPEDVLGAGIERTIDYMTNRPMRELSPAMLKAVCDATGFNAAEVKAAQERTFHADIVFMKTYRDQILDWIWETPYGDAEGSYDRLPMRYQVRVLRKFEDYVQKQRVRAMEAVVGRGIANALGELVLLNDLNNRIVEYKDTRSKREPDFSEAYLAA